MNIQQALDSEAFEGAQLLAGKQGVTREIKSFDVMEVPDIEDWLTEGVLLLTTFYSLQDRPDKQIEVFQEMIDANAAGLVVKIGRYIDELPDKIYELAEEHHMPIISVPVDIPYRTISELLFSHHAVKPINNEQSIFQLINKLSIQLGAKVVVTNAVHEVITYSTFPATDGVSLYEKVVFPKRVNMNEAYYIISENHQKSYGNLVFPLISHVKVKGYLHIYCKDPHELISNNKDYIETMRNIILKTLNLYEVKRDWEYFLSLKELGDLVKTSGEFQLISNFVIFSIDMKMITLGSFQCVQRLNVFLEHINILVEQQFPTVYKLNEEGNFLFVVAQEEAIDRTIIKEQLSELSDKVELLFNNRPTFYVGQVYNKEEKIQDAVDEIIYLIDIKEEFQIKQNLIERDGLGVNHYLYKLKRDEQIVQYSKEQLQALIDYDRDNNHSLLETLRVYLQNNGNQKKTAENLYIHRRTLTYRIKRISEITKLDLQNADDRLMLSLAIRLVNTNRAGN